MLLLATLRLSISNHSTASGGCAPTPLLQSKVETLWGHLDHPGQLGHILSESSGSDSLYKMSGSDQDFYIVSRVLLMAFGPGDNGSVFPNSAKYVLNLVIDGHYILKRKKDTKGSRV